MAGLGQKLKNKHEGFTLIELLVVTAIIGILGILSATIISSILRSQNKIAIINEVRQNGDLVISKLERDIKQTGSVTGSSSSVTLTTFDSGTITWNCSSGGFTRQEGTASASSVINLDPNTGVRVSSCNFAVMPPTRSGSVNQIVTLTFTLEQRSSVAREEYQIKEPFEVTVGTRAY